MLDFNRANISVAPINIAINDAIAAAARATAEAPRPYLGASIVGNECLRKIQYDWWCEPIHPLRLRDIFARGHFFEEVSRQHLISAGFHFAPPDMLAFTAMDGLFRGHADGIIIHAPNLPGAYLIPPCLWGHKCVNNKGWRALERDGREKAYPQYYAQCLLYMAYLNVTNPALFTAVNADSCERLHLLVPFNAERAQAWSDRAVRIIEATRAGELLPRFTDDQTDWRCKMCSHRERCWR